MAGERFAGHVRHVLEPLLAPARHRAQALAEPDERIDRQRRAGHAQQRQPGVVIEQQRREADERQRLARQIADRFRDRALHLTDVVVDARQQLRRSCAARRTPPTDRAGGGTARCAAASPPGGRGRPSGSWRNSRRAL